MKKKVFGVDDDTAWRGIISRMAENYGWDSEIFSHPNQVIERLQGVGNSSECYPNIYLVDMRIEPLLKHGNSESPERLSNYIRDNNISGEFYFITGDISDHDEIVRERTGRTIILKEDYTFFKKLFS